MTEELQGLIEHAWRVGNGDPLTAIYMLREWTGLRLSEAARIIQESPIRIAPAASARGSQLRPRRRRSRRHADHLRRHLRRAQLIAMTTIDEMKNEIVIQLTAIMLGLSPDDVEPHHKRIKEYVDRYRQVHPTAGVNQALLELRRSWERNLASQTNKPRRRVGQKPNSRPDQRAGVRNNGSQPADAWVSLPPARRRPAPNTKGNQGVSKMYVLIAGSRDPGMQAVGAFRKGRTRGRKKSCLTTCSATLFGSASCRSRRGLRQHRCGSGASRPPRRLRFRQDSDR